MLSDRAGHVCRGSTASAGREGGAGTRTHAAGCVLGAECLPVRDWRAGQLRESVGNDAFR